MKRVLKWRVPVDDQPHLIGGGPVVHVGCQDDATSVQIWTEEVQGSYADGRVPRTLYPSRPVQVFGTGQEIPVLAVRCGSTLAADGALVWHVYALPRVGSDSSPSSPPDTEPEEV